MLVQQVVTDGFALLDQQAANDAATCELAWFVTLCTEQDKCILVKVGVPVNSCFVYQHDQMLSPTPAS